MKTTTAVETPELTDASTRENTGKTLAQWFQELDALGALEKGRREAVNHLYAKMKLGEWWATTIAVEYERAKGAREKDGLPKGYSICSTKTVAAPLERVFRAFGDAKDLGEWLGAKSKVEFADGGSLANADGDRATITRLRANKDLRLVWHGGPENGGDTQVEVLFAEKSPGKTGITLNHTRIQSRRAADVLRAGWSEAFERLKAHLEGKSSND